MPRRPTAAVIAALALGTAACAEPAPSSGSGRRTPAPVAVGDAAARCSALSGPFQQDGDASAVDFDPARHRDRLARLSALFDATDPDIDDFVDHGGKLILVHGTLDWLVPRPTPADHGRPMPSRWPVRVGPTGIAFRPS
ncbi:tannase/feruloyl esterase family alpha/beta hydrolase [Pseudonocardia sp. GCM10023141]|uniref:tannase/feruloyl esterase family alpha/beta hydrolase n=1 Tax=Pseudonocardia sp. GCM10023141 TaxID=3252653 RepID=UPI00360C6DB9